VFIRGKKVFAWFAFITVFEDEDENEEESVNFSLQPLFSS